jgi:hypothetical protein
LQKTANSNIASKLLLKALIKHNQTVTL